MNAIFQNAEEIKKIIPKDKKFTLIGGCFDLIHVGHLHLLEYAASLEDLLVVAILSDYYAGKYKGSLRPIIKQEQRAKMVASIRFVDFVYISNTSPSSVETLQLLKPSSVVFDKGLMNSKRMKLRIKNIKIASPYTKVRFLARYKGEGISTSRIISKIRSAITS